MSEDAIILAVTAGLGGFYESHAAKDLKDGGTALGIFPYNRRTLEAGLRPT